MTDKTVDENITNKLDSNEFAKNQAVEVSKKEELKFNFFENKKNETIKIKETPKVEAKAVIAKESTRYHVIKGGDSLWIIANKYYSNPSQENINKIMKVNNIRNVYSTLQLGQKLTIPQ